LGYFFFTNLQQDFASRSGVDDVAPTALGYCSFANLNDSCLHDQGMHGAFVVQVTVGEESFN
jgi:hypothetical protein